MHFPCARCPPPWLSGRPGWPRGEVGPLPRSGLRDLAAGGTGQTVAAGEPTAPPHPPACRSAQRKGLVSQLGVKRVEMVSRATCRKLSLNLRIFPDYQFLLFKISKKKKKKDKCIPPLSSPLKQVRSSTPKITQQTPGDPPFSYIPALAFFLGLSWHPSFGVHSLYLICVI